MSFDGGAPAPSFLDRITTIHGRLSDLNAVWFPFLFLKPQPHEIITPARRLGMTFCFGIYTAMIWLGWSYAMKQEVSGRDWAISMLRACAFFAVWFRIVTVPLWNRRARRM